MNRREFALMVALVIVGIPAAFAAIWVIDAAAGTGWALPVAACVLLLVFLFDWGAGKATTR